MREVLIMNLKRLTEMLKDEKAMYGVDIYGYGTRSQVKNLMKQLRLDTIKYEKELYDWRNVDIVRAKYRETTK
jgi:hypothetical protein